MKRLTATCLALLLAPALALADVPVRVRVLKGSRQGPALVDPRLGDLAKQLGKLSYLRWDQVSEQRLSMADKKTEFVPLPDGENVALTVQEVRGDTVTVEVALAQRNTMSRLTIEKGQRIVHQVSGEKAGVAYFVTVHAWP
ncbi:MAG: hypothetical protein IPO09_18500 [Anaeromyxobacter sp.]|nr:hypothetical protein [Anaeromyxobacter sp.]MBL0276953.1 hypothetical protein [Anaeromyxobacter sp.]